MRITCLKIIVSIFCLCSLSDVKAASIFPSCNGWAAVLDRCKKEEPEEENVDEFGIIEATMKCTDCLDYMIVGECNWISYYIFSVEWDVSIVARHYLPDYIVSVYSSVSAYGPTLFKTDDFFREMGSEATGLETNNSDVRTQKNSTSNAAAGGRQPNINTNLDYKKVDILVNPGILIWNEIAESSGFSCWSNEEIPGMPKFISDVDPAWRGFLSGNGGLEGVGAYELLFPQSTIGFPRMSRSSFEGQFNAIKNFDAKKLLESFKNIIKNVDFKSVEYWGPIFPRNGWTSLPHDSMSALVAASRAADILTNISLPHLVMPVGDNCDNSSKSSDQCWEPDGVELSNDENKFQLIYPYVNDWAAPLPREGSWSRGGNEIQGLEDGSLSAKDHAWAWVLWRRYECCKKEGMFFVGAIKWD